jgi:hypothetical protein
MNSAWTLLSEEQMRAIQPPESDHEARRTIAVLKGSAEYQLWVNQLSRTTRIPPTTLLDIALSEWAQLHGHEPPPRRL